MASILVVEDSFESRNLIKTALAKEHSITEVETITEARSQIETTKFDLILLDVNLPDGNGYDFCPEILNSEVNAGTQIIFITVRDNPSDKVHGFYCGADDYITKPFNLSELKARVDARIRRQKSLKVANKSISNSGIEINLETQKAYIQEEGGKNLELDLTPIEFKLLYTFLDNPHQPFSRERLISRVWPQKTHVEQRGIDTHISHLRKKLGEKGDYLRSVYGMGYIFRPPR
jgi:two-component system phosphate regulon response regulator PhoB